MDASNGDQCDEFAASMTRIGRSQARVAMDDTQAENDVFHQAVEEGRGHAVGERYEQ